MALRHDDGRDPRGARGFEARRRVFDHDRLLRRRPQLRHDHLMDLRVGLHALDVFAGLDDFKDLVDLRFADHPFVSPRIDVDARDGMVAAEGWVETSAVSDVELAKRMEDAGVQCLICTDIARDGMLSGPNLGQLTRIQRAVKCDIVASGGVTNLSDIAALRDCGLYGAICGRSIYKGTLSLREAIQIADIR